MSLRGRVIALVGLVLLVSLSLYVAMAWNDARRDFAAELEAARRGGAQTVRSAFEDLPRSNHPARDLRQLIATFDHNRHLRAILFDRSGAIRAASLVALPKSPAPAWFAGSFGPLAPPMALAVPGNAGSIVRLEAEPAIDIAALWQTSRNAVGLFAVAAALAILLIYWVIGQALKPLAGLSHGLGAIGAGDYRERVAEEGAPELLVLQRGFNAMAAQLAEIDARNRTLEAQLLTIQDEERAEFARDLHDEIGPHLFAVALDAEMIDRSLRQHAHAQIPDYVKSIQSAVSYTQRQVRDLISRLRPTRAAELGLKAALADLVRFWQARQPQVAFVTEFGVADDLVSGATGDVIYRLVQEAVANALKHADTRRLTIRVIGHDQGVAVAVASEGLTRPVTASLPGLGLISMRERVQAQGGILNIERADAGWRICADFAHADRS